MNFDNIISIISEYQEMIISLIFIVLMFIIVEYVLPQNKFLNSFYNKNTWNKVIDNLIKQGITNLEQDINEEEIIKEVKEYYKNNYNDENLNLKLNQLENSKAFKSKFIILNFNSVIIALVVGVLGYIITINGGSRDETYSNIKNILFTALALLIMITFAGVHDLRNENRNNILDVSINIHKSVIQEQLKKIEGKKQQKIEKNRNKQNELLILELKEIQNLLKCNNEEKTIIAKACNKIINDIF